MGDANPLLLTAHEEPHNLHIDESHFPKVKHNVLRLLRLDRLAQVRQLLRTDSSAHNQR